MNSDATTQTLLIFIYRTLMIGQPNDFIWQDSIHRIAAAFITNCCLYDLGYYPMMITKPGRKVVGRLVRLVKDQFSQVIQKLEHLEGHTPDLPKEADFRRVKCKFQLPQRTEWRPEHISEMRRTYRHCQVDNVEIGQNMFLEGVKILLSGGRKSTRYWIIHIVPPISRQATVNTTSNACHPARKQYHMVLLNLLKIWSASTLIRLAPS